jgi:BA14K-like protein
MFISTRKLTAIVLATTVAVSTVGVASAAPMSGLAIKNAAPSNIETVQWRRGWGWGPGVAAGIIGGAVIGGMLANPYGYGPGPYYYAGPGPYYAAPVVVPGPVYAPGPAYRDAVAYCMRRYRSYDPSSGTFLGYDGMRHPCP